MTSMKVIDKTIPAAELPADWQREGQLSPDERVRVRIEPADEELAAAANLAELMTIIGRRIQERGLTQEDLDEILQEE